MSRTYRVIQWATGTVGTAALRHFVQNPVIDVVGVYVTNPDKVGRSAGELAGLAPGGVAASSDIDALLALKPDAVLFAPAYRLVQRLLGAKRDLALDRELKRLDAFDAVILDDLGYVQQDREEMEVLFTFLSQRYERRSVLITSNLVFSQWDQIFKNPMTTVAAIDRLVHHAIILEMVGPSIREEEAKAARRGNGEPHSSTSPEATV